MGEPFKNLFNERIINGMGAHLSKAWPEFDSAAFAAMAAKNLDELELKARSVRITEALTAFLPDDFQSAASIMLASLAPDDGGDIGSTDVNGPIIEDWGIEGWAVMPMTHYVGLQGLAHFDLSMMLLKEMTKRSSSEFGIRFFLIAEPERTLSVLETWLDDPNYHVRRLISEGTRPRLPWAGQAHPALGHVGPPERKSSAQHPIPRRLRQKRPSGDRRPQTLLWVRTAGW